MACNRWYESVGDVGLDDYRDLFVGVLEGNPDGRRRGDLLEGRRSTSHFVARPREPSWRVSACPGFLATPMCFCHWGVLC